MNSINAIKNSTEIGHELFRACIEQAKLALEEKEVAIGCVFYHVELGKIVAQSRNSVNATKNATRHAELNCIDDVIATYGNEPNFWTSIVVYVTCEPCIMCARILRFLKIKKVYYGCSNERFGGCRSVINVATNDKIGDDFLDFEYGIREEETIGLLKTFYAGENLNAPEDMRKVKKQKISETIDNEEQDKSDDDHLIGDE